MARDPKSRGVKRQFHKMQGLGNDFVLFDGRTDTFALDAAQVRAIADRRTGIGCDQLILLERSDRADLSMRIWNADGSAAEACGNASRCVVSLTGAETIETAGGMLRGRGSGDDIEVTLAPPRFEWDAIPLAFAMETSPLPMAWDEFERPFAVNVGNPHLVFVCDSIDERRLTELGPVIEHDPVFPERINVNLAVIEADGIELRTWERGAGLTLACGTGACATAVAAIAARKVTSPVQVRMKGGALTVDWAPGEPLRMRGPATHVFSGEIDLERFS